MSNLTLTQPRSGVFKAQWTGFTASGDKGTPLDAVNYVGTLTAQAKGLPNGTSALVIEGSNEPTSGYVTLTGPTGNTLSLTADGMRVIAEAPLFVRPRVDGVTAGATPTGWELTIVGRTNLR
jgi:hypothetical protein